MNSDKSNTVSLGAPASLPAHGLYGRGKCYLFAKGQEEYGKTVYHAFFGAMDLVCRIN